MLTSRRSASRRSSVDGVDRAGKVEIVGVEFIPEEDRDSTPGNVAMVFIGANLCFPAIIFGWLGVIFGLSFSSTVSSAAVGLIFGTAIVLPLSRVGPRTGTNATVSSGADFGIRGRFIGSFVTFAFALVFVAVTVWTSGDALTSAAQRLFGVSDGPATRALGYGLIAVMIIVIVIYGHGTIVAAQKFIVPIMGLMMVLGFFAYSDGFTNAGHQSGDYLLGGYWQTWVLSAVLNASGPVSYATNINDYTRRISLKRFSDRQIALGVGVGLLVGEFFAVVYGAYTAVTFAQPSDSYTADLISESPGWYLLPIVLLALAGGLGQGALCLYSCALDLEGVFTRFSRVQTTLGAAAAALLLLYLGAFVFDAVESISAANLMLLAITAPWIGVIVVGTVMREVRGQQYDPIELQAFAEGRQGGRYWYAQGWNVPTCTAWACGAAFGLLTVDARPFYTGFLAGIANGVDVSLLGSFLIAAIAYWLAIVAKPSVLQ